VSLAVFALAAVIWVVLLVPLARRGRAELAAEAADPSRLSRGSGARPWTTSEAAEAATTDEDAEWQATAARLARRRAACRRAAVRRRRVLLLLVVAAAAGMRSWAVLGGRWWVAAAGAGLLLAGYLAALVGRGWRRSRRHRTWAGVRSAWPGWTGPVAPSTE
jgi:hypothetical protein